MTPRLAAFLVLPFPLAFAVCMGAGLLGLWQPQGWEWPACVLGLIGSLAATWQLARAAATP